MDNTYQYDSVNNVTGITNSAPLQADGLGGQMNHSYGYDRLYRLTSASGSYTGRTTGSSEKTASYTLSMSYDNLHNIISKKQDITQKNMKFGGTLMAGYDLKYTYADSSQQISSIADQSYRTDSTSADSIQKSQQYSYDANGNLISVNTVQKNADGKQTRTNQRRLLWDEENRLLALSDNGYVSNYWYDASGERMVKTSGDGEGVLVNGILSGARTGTTNFTAYVNPYLVITNSGQCSKHFYIGSQRVVSKLCDAGTIPTPLTDSTAAKPRSYFIDRYADLTDKIKTRYDSLGVTYRGTDHAGSGFDTLASVSNENQQYFYHSDHLGSSSLITNLGGDIVQHIEYVPFGEVFIEESKSTWNTPYKFNAKELDEETGLYYYGARYYDPRTSVWLSVDPLAEKYPGMSSYVYCANNPVMYVDPDGREKIISFNPKGNEHNIRAALKAKNDGAIHLWAHGNSTSILVYNGGAKTWIKNSKDLDKYLMKYSKVWRNRDQDQQITIVLHSCETGSGDSNNPSLARKLSEELKNTTIVAPTEMVIVDPSTDTELGTYKTKDVNVNGETLQSIEKEGRWLEFENGKITESHSGDWKPKESTFNRFTNMISSFIKSKVKAPVAGSGTKQN